MAEKWQVAVYNIHKTAKETKEVYAILDIATKTYTQKQQKILRTLLAVEGRHKYLPQALLLKEVLGFELYLYYRKHPKAIPDWKKFFHTSVEEDQEIHVEPRNMNESFVFFLYHKNDKNLYAISGGYGAFSIQKFIKDDFGIDILVRVIESKGDKILRHAKEFGVTGGLVGVAKYFRQHYNFHENKNFGNIYREISASIDKDIARELGIHTDETKQCIAKNSFKVNQSITFSEMINVVDKLNIIVQRDANFSVNDIKQIDVKKDQELIKNLEEKVLNEIWDNRTNISQLEETLDFIHQDFEKFLLAKKYKYARQEYEDNSTLFSWIMNRMNEYSKEDFIKNIHMSSVNSFDENDELLTSEKVFNHLVCEVQDGNESYFLFNGKYFQITGSFKETLNQSCKSFIIENYDDGLNRSWNDNDTEGVYNLSYKGDHNTIVLDTVTPENIESCDIMKYNDEYVYLYHVKKGFNGSMRDLTNQVFIAASRILEDLKADKHYLKNVYSKMEAMEAYQSQIASEEEFLSIFSPSRKLCFVLAVKDSGNNRRIENIESFTSNVAKFSLNGLIQNMRNLGIDFKITQINALDSN